MGLDLIQIEDIPFQQDAEIDGLPNGGAEVLQLRPGYLPQVRLPQNGAGQQHQPGTHPVAFADRILDQILPLRQGGDLPENCGGGKIQIFHQLFQGPLRLPVHKALQDPQGPEDAGNLFFGHGASHPFSGEWGGLPKGAAYR